VRAIRKLATGGLARNARAVSRRIECPMGEGRWGALAEELQKSAEERRNRLLDPPTARERRQQQAAPAAVAMQSLAELTFTSLLQAVRPDWSAKDVQAVEEKLAKIEIHSAGELLQQLRAHGVKWLNSRLKAAGQRGLKSETLAALRAYGESMDLSPDASN